MAQPRPLIEDLSAVRQMSDETMAEILASLAASTAWKHELPFAAEFFREVNRRLLGRPKAEAQS